MKTPRILTATVALLLAPAAFAVIETWDGGGANDNLNNGSNWADNTAPVSDLVNTDLIFAGGAGLAPNVSVAFSTRSLTFNISAGAFVFDGLALSIGTGGIVNNDATTMTFNNLVSFAGATGLIDAAVGGLTFGDTVSVPASMTVTGAGATSFENISSSGQVTKNGTGTMTWTPNVNTAFDINVVAGTLTMGADGVTDVFTGTASISLNNSSILNINESMRLDGARLVRLMNADVNLATGKTLTIQGGGDFEVTGVFTNNTASNIAITGAGSTLSTTSTLELVGGSTVTVAAGGSIDAGAGAISIGTNGNGTVTLSGAGSSIAGGALNVGLSGADGTLTFNAGTTGAFGAMSVSASGVAGTSGIVNITSAAVTGTGLAIATGAVAASGTVTVSGADGTLTLTDAAGGNIGAASASTATLNVNTGGVFTSGSGLMTVHTTGVIAIGGGTYNSLGDLTLNGGELTRTAAGVFTLAAGNTLTLQAGGDATFTGAFAHATASTINITGLGSTFSTTSTLQVQNGATINVLANGNLFTGAGELRVGTAGASGTVTVDGLGSSVTAGGVQLGLLGSAGTLTFRNDSAGLLGAIEVSDSGVVGTSGLLQIESSASVTGTALVIADNVSANTGTVTITGAGSFLTLSGAGTATIGAASASTATLNVNTSGTFNSGTGLTTVNATGTIAIDGGTFNANGDVTLNGGQLTRASGTFALDAARTLTVQAGGDAIFTGFFTNSTASTVLVTGAGSTLTASSAVEILGGAALNVAAGGSVATVSFNVATSGGDATVTVDGAGSSLSATGFSTLGLSGQSASVTFTNDSSGTFAGMNVGVSGTNGTSGLVSVQSGADVTATALSIGTGANATTGTVTVTGAGSTFALTGAATMTLGATTPDADLEVNTGGLFQSGTGLTTVNASGTIEIGSGGTYHSRGNLTLAAGVLMRDAAGVLTLDPGTVFTVQAASDAIFTGAFANTTASTINVAGTAAKLSTTTILSINGGSTLNVSADGDVNAGTALVVGQTAGGGTVTVSGAGSIIGAQTLTLGLAGQTGALTFSNNGAGAFGTMIVGQSATPGTTGTLTIQTGAFVNGVALSLGTSGAAGTATVNGAGSTLTLNSATVAITIGGATGATSTLNVQSGGAFTTTNLATNINATGVVAIAGGTFTSNNNITINGGRITRDAAGTFTVADGRSLSLLGGGDVFVTGNYNTPNIATISVNGAGSFFSVNGVFGIGGGTVLNAAAGGDISAGTVNVGSFGGSGTATLDGAGTTLDAATLTVGQNGHTGTLTFSNGASGLFTNISVDVASVAGTSGTLTIQSGASVSGATLNVATGTLANTGTVNITGAGSALTLSGATTIGAASASSGILNIESGGTFITGTGLTNVRETGDVNVNAGGTMIVRGNMNVATSLDIANGGVVILGGSPPPAPEFALGEFDFGVSENGVQTAAVPEPGVGALLLSALGLFGWRGRVRGARSSRGDELPDARDSEDSLGLRSTVRVVTGFLRGHRRQALLLAVAAALSFTPFAAADTWDNSSGNQLWNSATNWLDNTEPTINDDVIFNEGSPGAASAALSGTEVARSLTFNASFALFIPIIIGTPTITVDSGEITVASGKSASIAVNLISASVLEKLGAGALTLSVPVTFTGQSALFIRQGTLTLASGASVTSDSALMGLDGSTTVNVTGAGALWSNPNGMNIGVNTNGSSTLNITAGGTVTLGDHIGGGNTLANTTLTLDGGTLDMQGHRIGNSGNSAALIDNRNFRSGTLKSVAEINNGTVPLVKTTAGTLILDGTNSYTGGTTISGGTLQIGNGSTTGSIVGNVTNNGTLAFNRSDNIVFPGVISGTGALLKLGSNQLTLTGMNTYAGMTTVSAGTLVLDASLTSGAAIDLASGAALHLGSSFSSAPRPVILRGLPGSATFIALQKFGTSAASLGGPLTIADNPNISVAAGGKLTLSGGITDNGGNSRFSFFGTGELVVSGPGTFSGGVSVIGGQLTVAHNSALGTGQVSVSDLSGGAAIPVLAFADGVTFSSPMNLRRATLRALGDSTVTSNITLDGFVGSNLNLDVPDAAHALTLAGDIAHTGASGYSVTKTGAGTLDILGTIGAGDIPFTANAGTTNFGEDQTLAALNIGAGAIVSLGLPAPAPPFTAVPEPGVGALLLSALGILGTPRGRIRVARSPRALAEASRLRELPESRDTEYVRAFRAVQKVRETRALPGPSRPALSR